MLRTSPYIPLYYRMWNLSTSKRKSIDHKKKSIDLKKKSIDLKKKSIDLKKKSIDSE